MRHLGLVSSETSLTAYFTIAYITNIDTFTRMVEEVIREETMRRGEGGGALVLVDHDSEKLLI